MAASSPDSPAAEAGLRAGDELIAINGNSENLDFTNIALAAALSGRDEAIDMTVRRPDGSTEDLSVVAETSPGGQMREFGIMAPQSLKLAAIKDPNVLIERTGLHPGDTVTAVNGQPVAHEWEFAEVVKDTLAPSVSLTAERPVDGAKETIEVDLALAWSTGRGDVNEASLNHVYSMVPRLCVLPNTMAGGGDDDPAGLQPGDVILTVGAVDCPTYAELREITIEYEDKPLSVKVLRVDPDGVEQTVALTVTPRRDPELDRVVIGFLPALDVAHAVVAKTIDAPGGPARLDIPRGARITAVNGKAVANYFDVIAEVRRWDDQAIKLEYELPGQAEGGGDSPGRPRRATDRHDGDVGRDPAL